MISQHFIDKIGLKYEEALYQHPHLWVASEMYTQHRLLEGQGYVDFIYGAGELEGLAVAKYTRDYPTLAFNKTWNPYVAWARGLVYDLTDPNDPKIIGIPFSKFFNYLENPQRVPDPQATIIDISEKADGSLGTAFFWKGQWWMASSGAVNSPQAEKGTAMLRAKPWLKNLQEDCNYIFEIIYPENQIILDYGDMEDLILLGARYVHPMPNMMMTAKTAFNLIGDDRVRVVKNYNHINLSSEAIPQFVNEAQSDKLVEGVIVTYSDGTKFKFKSDQYVKLHVLKRSITFNSAFQAIREGNYQDYLSAVPEEFRPIVDGWYDEIQDKISRLLTWADVWWQYVKSNGHSTPGKDLALFLTQNVPPPAHKYVFNLAKGKSNTEAAYNDYRNFHDVIKWQLPNSQP